MKRFFSFLLIFCLLATAFAGCAQSGPSGIAPSESEQAAELMSEIFGQPVSADSLQVQSMQTIDGQLVTHCSQTYKGVEIYDSGIVTIDGDDEALVIGTYYNMAEAFGDDFDALVQQASQVPDWMVDGYYDDLEVTYHTDTLRPVIYIYEGMPIVAIEFDMTLSGNGSSERYTMVMDAQGKTCYEYSSNLMGFNPTSTQSGVTIAEKDGKYYAYDMENSVYVSNVVTLDDDELDSFYDGTGAKLDVNLIYRLKGSSSDNMALDVLSTMSDVMQWYKDKFGYYGVDGKGGEAMAIVGVDYDKLSSIAANACEKGHVFLFSVDDNSKTAADAPEILAHEMCHAVLKNVVGLSNKNQSGSLHEAISDVFACLYDPDSDWVIGSALGKKQEKNIAGNNRIMDDFRYDWQYMKDYDKGGYIYLGEDNILTYIRKKIVGETSCSIEKYRNSEIVSGAMYKIWKNVFNMDDDLMGKTLMDCLQYLPGDADFSQFRAAFMYSTGKLVGTEAARRVGTQFDAVGIRQDKNQYTTIRSRENPDYLLDMMEMTYGQVRMMNWDSCNFTETFENWYCLCDKEGVSLNFCYEGTDEAQADALPISANLFDNWSPVRAVPIADDLYLSMTYGEIAKIYDISPLVNTQYNSSEYPISAEIIIGEYNFELYFNYDGVDETAVLYGVAITPK